MATKSKSNGKSNGKARKASSKAASDNAREAVTAITLKSAKKCDARNWPLDKFRKAVVARAKRMGVTIKTGDMEKVYDAKVTIPDAVRVLVA